MSNRDNGIEFTPEAMEATLYTNRLAYSDAVGMKFESIDSQEQDKLVNAFTRGILIECMSEGKVFKIDPFKKLLQDQMNLTVPNGTIIPLLSRVNQVLMDVFGYCIAPVNYGGKHSLLDESASGMKELILVNILPGEELKKANACNINPHNRALLLWTVSYLYLNSGCEKERLESHLLSITGDSAKSIRENLESWERGRYITRVNTTMKGIELVKYEVGLRTFMEIGYKNITKFICTVMNKEYTEEVASKWLDDTVEKEPPAKKVEKRASPAKKAPAAKKARTKKSKNVEEEEILIEEEEEENQYYDDDDE